MEKEIERLKAEMENQKSELDEFHAFHCPIHKYDNGLGKVDCWCQICDVCGQTINCGNEQFPSDSDIGDCPNCGESVCDDCRVEDDDGDWVGCLAGDCMPNGNDNSDGNSDSE